MPRYSNAFDQTFCHHQLLSTRCITCSAAHARNSFGAAMRSRNLFAAAIFLRLVLLAFGTWQDNFSRVKYTDIDYKVYTDAARYVTLGESPYLRSTYRYTPLVAMLLTPNIWIHEVCGKLIFSMADIGSAALMDRLMQERGVSGQQERLLSLSVWLFSPFTATISTRGNGEALVTLMLLEMLLLMHKGMHVCIYVCTLVQGRYEPSIASNTLVYKRSLWVAVSKVMNAT
jgi:hypothetical protein